MLRGIKLGIVVGFPEVRVSLGATDGIEDELGALV